MKERRPERSYLMNMEPVAVIHTDFPDKFGIPRQSGMLSSLESTITFLEPFSAPEAVRGLNGYSHLWLIWLFDRNENAARPHLTVRPPRLGGNTRMGVFATRSPFRPNPIGLSCVRLERIGTDSSGHTVLTVTGADLCDGTPILDIKPYIPYTDSHPEALSGFSVDEEGHVLRVVCAEEMLSVIPAEKREGLLRLLSLDPRPAYQKDGREYGVFFSGFNVRFSVEKECLTVHEILPAGR